MDNKPTVRDLARVLASRHLRSKEEQFALLLGKACSREAGQPYEKVIEKLISQLNANSTVLAGVLGSPTLSAILGQSSTLSAEGALSTLLARIPETLRPQALKLVNRLLQQYYANLPVPSFYQDLGALIKASYFSRVITTNYDNLLEQALDGPPIPWRRDRDYLVIDVPAFDRDQLKHYLLSADSRGMLILKMHGDLRQEGDPINFTEIEAALSEHRKTLYSELSDDLVVVGYEGESQWVGKGLHAQSSGDLWWVSEADPDPTLSTTLQSVRAINVIDGPEAAPHMLFGLLRTILSRGSDTSSVSIEILGASAIAAPGEVDQMSNEGLQHAALQDALTRAQNALARLRQSSPPGSSPDIDAQIEYQRDLISELEDQIRLQHKDRILALLGELSSGAKNANLDATTRSFFDQQVTQVISEYSGTQPNQDVVSAAISAILVLTRRMGQTIAPLDRVRELSSFASQRHGEGNLMGPISLLVTSAGNDQANFIVQHDDVWPAGDNGRLTDDFPNAFYAKWLELVRQGQSVPYSWIRKCSTDLYQRLLPDQTRKILQDILATVPADTHPVLNIYNSPIFDNIPWELMHDGVDHLGLRFQIARMPLVASPPAQVNEARSVANIYHVLGRDVMNLATEAALFTQWRDTFGMAQARAFPASSGVPEWPTVDTIEESWAADILHLTCHGIGPQGWTLFKNGGDPCVIDSSFVTNAKLKDGKPLIFANACRSADSSTQSSLVSEFLNKGTRNVVGTFALVTRELAIKFGAVFYSKLFTPVAGQSLPIAEALRLTKQEFHPEAKKAQSCDPSYLFYCLFGARQE